MSIPENINNIISNIPSNVKLVAVSKTKPNSDILEAYYGGCKVFGENKIQDLVKKYEELPKDIEWHMIGHLQTNKVKYIAPFISLIHAVDSIKLLKTINKEAAKNNRTIDCLIQIKIAEEETKFGMSVSDAKVIFENNLPELSNINIIGLMGMASFSDDKNQVRNEFKYISSKFSEFKSNYFSDNSIFKEISMGMSGDYKIAIEEGSTIIRVGSTIFGHRNY